jgi:hypothetical protein
MSHNQGNQGAFADTLRHQHGAGKADHLRATALPGILQRLSNNPLASAAHADRRTTEELVKDVAAGDRCAETPLYVRVAADLDRSAARVPGDSVMSREDMHQEGAERLIRDTRAGIVTEKFGGNVGAFIGSAVRTDLMQLALALRPGAPAIAPQQRRNLRAVLISTADEHGNYNVSAAAMLAVSKYGWTLRLFWAVYSSMFASSDRWDTEDGSGLTVAETTADETGADAMARVEDRDTARRIRETARLTAEESDVIDAVTGVDGHVHTTAETAERLGLPPRTVERRKASAVAKLREAADLIGATEHYA